jgi:acyl-CoA dehydrogenase
MVPATWRNDMTPEQRAEWWKKATAFAADRIAPRAGALGTAPEPPADLWAALAKGGFFAVALPGEFGGADGDFALLAEMAEAMVATGGNLGFVMSWMSHQLSSRLHIAGQGTAEQKQRYLADLAAGRLTPCLAISEPGAGAHPKRLSASAVRDGGDIVLNGEKAFLTNGPIADLFIILAISGEAAGRKQFTAYVVEKGTPGLSLTEGIKIDFLKPSPHCGLKLDNCRIPAANQLGPEGRAFDVTSLPMRQVEDALFAANMSGALRYEVTRLAGEAGDALDDDGMAELGRLIAAPDGMSALSLRAMALIDAGAADAGPTIQAMSAAARDWARHLQARIDDLEQKTGREPSPERALIVRDIRGMLSIARAAHDLQARKRAQTLLEQGQA